jgi:hypothetical protein
MILLEFRKGVALVCPKENAWPGDRFAPSCRPERKFGEASALALGCTVCNSYLDNVVLINVFCHE